MTEKTILKLTKFIVAVGLVGIVITVLTYLLRGHINFNDINNDTIGTFGDFIGGVIGTLFGIATTLLVWLTYKSQKRELKQNGLMLKKQNFENTFFNLIKVQQDIKNSIRFEINRRLTRSENDTVYSTNVLTGDTFFEFAQEDFHKLYIKTAGLISPKIEVIQRVYDFQEEEEIPEDQPEKRIKKLYKKFFDTYHFQIGHYFRHLYYILKFIEENEIEEISKNPLKTEEIKKRYKFYAGIVQAQMGSAELFLLFYNAICFNQMNRLIKKYNLLENLATEDLADITRHKDLYGEGVLKSRLSMLD